MVKLLPKFEDFTVLLKNRSFISKIRRSKVTDYAALNCFIVHRILLLHEMGTLISGKELKM